MTYRRIYSVLFGSILLLLAPAVTSVAAQTAYRFAYFRVAQFGDAVELVTVDPVQADSPVKTQAYPLPPDWLLSAPQLRSLASPDGEWIASFLASTDNRRLMAQLYNPGSGEARQIIEGYITTRGQSAAWSPDGHYLALVIGQHPGDLELMVYSVTDDRLTNLTNDEFDQRDIGWSPDSSRVMTFTRPCSINDPCGAQLEMLDVAQGSRIATIDLSALTLGGSAACNPNTSPDSRYVSLVSNCGFEIAAGYDFPREVYVWDLQTGDLRQITDFYAESNGRPFAAIYNHRWLDANVLLVGADYQIADTLRRRQLFTYHAPDAATDVLSTAIGAGFVFNAPTGELVSGKHVTFEEGRQQVEFATINRPSGATGDFTINTRNAGIAFPSGCELQWSPDGTLVAYTVYTGGGCQGSIEKILFITPTGSRVAEHSVVPDETANAGYIVPIGWIRS